MIIPHGQVTVKRSLLIFLSFYYLHKLGNLFLYLATKGDEGRGWCGFFVRYIILYGVYMTLLVAVVVILMLLCALIFFFAFIGFCGQSDEGYAMCRHNEWLYRLFLNSGYRICPYGAEGNKICRRRSLVARFDAKDFRKKLSCKTKRLSQACA